MGHRIQIWAQKDLFYPQILGRDVGPISVTRTVFSIKPECCQFTHFVRQIVSVTRVNQMTIVCHISV